MFGIVLEYKNLIFNSKITQEKIGVVLEEKRHVIQLNKDGNLKYLIHKPKSC